MTIDWPGKVQVKTTYWAHHPAAFMIRRHLSRPCCTYNDQRQGTRLPKSWTEDGECGVKNLSLLECTFYAA
jgi:hypothetical protein